MELWGFKATLIVNRVVTDRSGVLPFCPNRTSQKTFCLPNRTEQNQTQKKTHKKTRA